MTEAIFGLAGVLIGASISWFQTYWFAKQETNKAAQYLAIRVICVLDKFLVQCIDVVKDKGLYTLDGGKVEKVSLPDLTYPTDVDWKSIDPELMYKLLSFPTDVESFHRQIQMAWDIDAKDHTIGLEERAFYYAQWGLHAYKLTDELCKKHNIKAKTYNDPNYDPVADLTNELSKIHASRTLRRQNQMAFLTRMKHKMGAA